MIERCEWCYGRRIGMNDDPDFDGLICMCPQMLIDELARLRAENERLKADAARLDSGRIALWGPGAVQPDGRCDDVQTEHSGVDLRKAIDEAIEMATPEWRATYCVP